MKLDPLSLRLFVGVIEEGTIAAIAVREHIAAAAVSKRLSELEDLLGTQLLVRTNKGVVPTAAGLALLFKARSVLNDLSSIVSQMKDFSCGYRGSVHVLANISATTQFLPELLKSFAKAQPRVQVTLEEQESLAIIKAVSVKNAEIGVFTRLPHDAEIEVYPFRSDELVVALPADHPLAPRREVSFAETLAYDYVALGKGTQLHFQLLKAASDVGKAFEPKILVSSYDALWSMVRSGVGIAILPRGSADQFRTDAIRIVTLRELWAVRELCICISSLQRLSAAAKLFFDHLQAS